MSSRLHVVYTESPSLDALRPVLAELLQPPEDARITSNPISWWPSLLHQGLPHPRASGLRHPAFAGGRLSGYQNRRGSWVGERSTSHAYRVRL